MRSNDERKGKEGKKKKKRKYQKYEKDEKETRIANGNRISIDVAA